MPEPFAPEVADETAPSEAAVLDVVRAIVTEVIGEEYASELDIGLSTCFYTDVEIESIELVALGEKLQAHYGDRVDFAGWLATMEVDDIITMTVGDLVGRIVHPRSEHETPSPEATAPVGRGSPGG